MKVLTRWLVRIRRTLLLSATQAVMRRQSLMRYVSALLDQVPSVRRAVRRVLRGPDWRAPEVHMPQRPDDLSPDTLAAYRALKDAFAKQCN